MIDFSILNNKPETPKAFGMSIDPPNVSLLPKSLDDLLNDLQDSQSIYFVTNGEFSLHNIVDGLTNDKNDICITLSSFSFTEVPTRVLGTLIANNQLKNLNILVDVRAKANYPGIFQQLKIFTENIGITMVHAKVTVIRTPEMVYTIIGSANWTTNKRFEVGFIFKDESIAEFNEKWIIDAINKFRNEQR